MLIQDYSTSRQAELRHSRTYNLRISYPVRLSGKLDGALRFVLKKIGFEALEDFDLHDGFKDLSLLDIDGNNLMIHLQTLDESATTEHIVFHTDDCLRDYHRYIVSGVEFMSRPEYNESGLQVKFLDDADNCYILLEERTYNEY